MVSLQNPKQVKLSGETRELLRQVAAANEVLDKSRPFSPEVAARIRTAFLPDRITTNLNMEGIVATRRQTLSMMDAMTVAANPSRGDQEILNALEGDELVFDCIQSGTKLSQNLIRQINLTLLNGMDATAGEYRTENVEIAGAAFFPPSPAEISALMDDLCSLFQQCERLEPIFRAAWVHGQFTLIHPFIDGNGRTGRLIQDYSLLDSHYLPTGIPSSQRDDYYESLEKADDGDWNDLVEMLGILQLDVITKTQSIVKEPEIRAHWVRKLAEAATARRAGTLHKRYLVWRERIQAIVRAFETAAKELDVASGVIGVGFRTYPIPEFEKWKRICQYGYATQTWVFSLLFFAEGQPIYRIIGFARRHQSRPMDTFVETSDAVGVYITGQEPRSFDRPNFENYQDRHVRLRELVHVDGELFVFYQIQTGGDWEPQADIFVEQAVKDLFEDIFYKKAALSS